MTAIASTGSLVPRPASPTGHRGCAARSSAAAGLGGLLIGLALGLVTTGAWATADGPDFYAVRGVARGDVLNIRTEPNAQATKMGKIPHDGTCIRNLGCKGGLSLQEFSELSAAQQRSRQLDNPRWCQIEYQGVRGWVSGRYLGESECRQ